VGDPDRRLGLVDVLAAGTGSAIDVDPEVGRVDVDLDRVIDFRVDVDRGERGVTSAAGIERRLAHQAMDAGFGAQIAIGIVAVDLDGGALDAGDVAVGLFQQGGLEAATFAVAQVLAQQHRRPVAGLSAAGAGLDFHEAVAGVRRIVEHPPELQVLDAFFDLLGVGFQREQRVLVVLFHRHLEEVGRVGERFAQTGQPRYRVFQGALLAAQRECGGGVVPDVRRLERRIDFYQAVFLVIEVKDTP
jgi:hypothetical protein